MDRRLSVIEADVKTLDLGVNDIKVSLARIEALLSAATGRVERVEAEIKEVLATAIGKTIGPVQFVGIIASCIVIAGAAAAVARWMAAQPWFWR